MKKLLSICLIALFISSCTSQKGFNYAKHNKSNMSWKHKAEHNNLPKCRRH